MGFDGKVIPKLRVSAPILYDMQADRHLLKRMPPPKIAMIPTGATAPAFLGNSRPSGISSATVTKN